MRNIAIIPARSGSKGLPDKNIRLLKGKPLMAYAIEAALESGVFDTIHVSTDSEKYAEIARQYGAEVLFLRSAETSSDTATTESAIREVLARYKEMGREFDTLAILQPTSPMRTGEDIRKAYQVFEEKKAHGVVSVCEPRDLPAYCYELPEDHQIGIPYKNNPYAGKRRQDLPTFHRINGAIYIARVDTFLETGSIYAKQCYASIMDKMNSVDVDSIEDFLTAETLMRYLEENKEI